MKKHRMSTFERLQRGPLNRQQRRQLGARIAAGDPGLGILNPNAAGIDVGNESHYVAVPPDRDPQPVREFGCWTQALHQLADWLVACRIDTVAMQSTGVYWIALYDIRKRLRITGATDLIKRPSLELSLSGRPVMREEFRDAVDWMRSDS